MKHGVLAFVLAVPLAGFSQSPTATVDFQVVDSRGAAVGDLSPADVSVRVNGRERPIRALELVDDSAPRQILLVLDEGLIPFGSEQAVRNGVSRLLGSLSTTDHVGVISLFSDEPRVHFSTDREATAARVAKIVGGRAAENDPCHRRKTLETLRAVTASMPRSLSSTLLFVSAGRRALPMPERDVEITPSGACQILPEEARAAAQAIAISQISFYVVHVGAGRSHELDDFAGSLGARTEILSFSDPGGLARAVASTRTFYRATIDVDPADKPGQAHRVALKTTRRGVRINGPDLLAIPRP